MRPPCSPRALAALGVLVGLVGLQAASLPREARAADSPASTGATASPVKGLRIVVPEARGKASDNRAALTKAVRRALSEGVGPLIPSQKLDEAQKKLKLKKDELTSPEGLAQAARAIDAQYVLTIEVTKEKWTYTARALLINSENAQIQMDFRSQYMKPAEEAEDRGRRIGARALLKLEDLLKQGPAPFAGANPALAAAGKSSDKTPAKGATKTDRPEPRAGASGGEPGYGSRVDGGPERGAEGGASGGMASGGGASGGGLGGSTSARVGVEPRHAATGEARELFRASVVGGAGILHTYDLSGASVSSSRLSYQLDPLAMLGAEVEVVLPGLPLGVLARAAYRPLRFEVKVQDAPTNDTANTPRGMFLDTQALVRWYLPLSGEGRSAYQLIPAAGVRLGLTTVERHPADPILGSTSFAPILALGARLPLNEVMELNVGADGGLILGYSESPTSTGAGKGSGFTLGGDVAARIWLSSAIAIAFDLRFDLEKVSFAGTPTRSQAPNEALLDASITTKDLRTGIGVAFRL